MSTIQTLPSQLSFLAGSATAEVPGGEAIASENQAFATTLSGLLTEFLQAGAVAAELPPGDSSATGQDAENLAALAFAVELEGQGLTAQEGIALPPGMELATNVAGEPDTSALAGLTSLGESNPLSADEGAAVVAAPLLGGMLDEGRSVSGEKDLLAAGLNLKQDGPGGQAKTPPNLPFHNSADDGKSPDVLRHDSLAAGSLFGTRAMEKSMAEFAAALTSAANKASTAGPAVAHTPDAGSALAAIAPAVTTASSSTNSLPQTPAIPISPHQSGFDTEVGERILWMTKNQLPAAEIRLNPAHLGPVEARVSVSNDQVSVVLMAHHSTTRDALELALPRLREMFADAGLTLSQANVSDQSSQQQQSALGDQRSDRQSYGQHAGGEVTPDSSRGEIETTPLSPSGSTILDVFA